MDRYYKIKEEDELIVKYDKEEGKYILFIKEHGRTEIEINYGALDVFRDLGDSVISFQLDLITKTKDTNLKDWIQYYTSSISSSRLFKRFSSGYPCFSYSRVDERGVFRESVSSINKIFTELTVIGAQTDIYSQRIACTMSGQQLSKYDQIVSSMENFNPNDWLVELIIDTQDNLWLRW
jgi:hypothetical protein